MPNMVKNSGFGQILMFVWIFWSVCMFLILSHDFNFKYFCIKKKVFFMKTSNLFKNNITFRPTLHLENLVWVMNHILFLLFYLTCFLWDDTMMHRSLGYALCRGFWPNKKYFDLTELCRFEYFISLRDFLSARLRCNKPCGCGPGKFFFLAGL